MDDLAKVIIENENLIYSIIKKYSNYYDIDDLYQVGVMGMIKAYNNYKENYPKLKDCEAYLKIELSLVESEAEIVSLRKYYNDIITDYNKMVKSVPSNFIALIMRCKTKAYFDGNELDKDKEEIKL